MARHPLSAYRLWLLVGTASLLLSVPAEAATAFDQDGWGTRADPDRSAPIYLMAQFHEPQPPVVPFVAPPVTPPVPPKVFAPLPLPPDSQAIKSSPPKTKTPSAPTTASKPAAAADPAAAARQAEAAERREHARNLQSVLTDMGYDPGPADGIVGSKTMDALFSWIADIPYSELQEEARHAAHLGDYRQLEELALTVMDRDAESGVATTAPVQAAKSDGTAELKKSALASVQQKLAELGYNPGPADGLAGDHTVGAINGWIDGLGDLDQQEAAREAAHSEDYATLARILADAPPSKAAPEATGEGTQEEVSVDAAAPQAAAVAENQSATSAPDIDSGINSSADSYKARVDEILNGPIDDTALAQVHAAYSTAYGKIIAFYKAKWNGWGTLWHPDSELRSVDFRLNFRLRMLGSGSTSPETLNEINALRAHKAEVESVIAMLAVIATTHNQATEKILAPRREAERTATAVPVEPPTAKAENPKSEQQTAADQAQTDIDYFMESKAQAEAELKSLEARTDISAEQKAALRDGVQSRIGANEVFLEDAKMRLAAEGGTFDGYDGKDFAEFDPYAVTQTDVELYKIAEEAKAAEQFYDELSRARDAINQTTDGLDAASLHEKVTALSERVTEGAESYQEVADLLHEYGTNIQVTRKQGALEYAQAMAEDAVLESERNLAYAQSVVNTSKNSVALLALGGMGYAAATSGFAAMGVVGLQSQAVMATLDGASSAIDGFDRGGAEEALKQGLLQGGKYYLPINTGMALTNKDATKTDVALGVLSDAANLYAGYQSLKSLAGKAAAAQARITEMTLSKSDQAISQAAKAAQQNGDDLVRSYQNAKFEVELAMRSGMGAEVSKAQDKLQQIVRAIDVSDEAKLALKTRGVLVQAEFVGDQAQFIKQPAQDIWKQKMQDMGWTDAGLDTGQIRNQSSAGTVGLDDDIRLLEPSLIDRLDDGTPKYSGPSDPNFVSDTNAFRQKLTKGGEVQSLTTWERDAQQAMEEAYQEVAGYSAKNNARVEMTTSLSDEAFKDVRVLQEGGTNQTSAGWAEQSASVTQTKMREGIAHANGLGLGDGPATASLSGTALQEATTEIKVATRELLKDLTGKALKAQPGFEMPAKIDRQIKILQGVVDGTYDPAVANALLKAQTDTSLAKTMESLGGHFEAILKFH